MSFTIDIQPHFDFKIIRIANNDTKVYIDIVTKGGLLNSWVQSKGSSQFDVIDGNDLSNDWVNFESNGFKSAKMNPFCCRLNFGQYDYNESSYKIEKFYLHNHAIHGLLYDEVFEIEQTEINDQCAMVCLSYHYQKNDAGYPFDYHVKLKWSFWKDNKIMVQTEITNNENEVIPMMDGWHPYFKLAESIDDCTLQFINNGILEYDKELIPTNKIIPNHEFENGIKLKGINLDNGYLLDLTNPICILENTQYKIVVTADHNYPYLQIYTPPHRKSIAIENLTGAPDSFNNKMGLHIMQPHEIWSLTTQYQLYQK
jgi:aldose 1-epimerase